MSNSGGRESDSDCGEESSHEDNSLDHRKERDLEKNTHREESDISGEESEPEDNDLGEENDSNYGSNSDESDVEEENCDDMRDPEVNGSIQSAMSGIYSNALL